MSFLQKGSRARGMALVAALGAASAIAVAKPAHADSWFQLGIVLPSPPPAVVVAPRPAPPPAYRYAYGEPYGYAYPRPYYAVPRERDARQAYAYGRYDWRHRHGGDRRDRRRDD